MEDTFRSLRESFTSPQLLELPGSDQTLVVETDGSSFAVGEVLDRKMENGKLHLVQFATMISEENKYSTDTREALGVIFTLKKLRFYLMTFLWFMIFVARPL